MDVEWALAELTAFIEAAELYRPPDPPGVTNFGDTRRVRGKRDQIIAAAQVVEPILDRVIPQWRKEVPEDTSGRWQQHRQAAVRAKAQLQRAAEVADKLGDNAPTITARSCTNGSGRALVLCGRAGTTGTPFVRPR